MIPSARDREVWGLLAAEPALRSPEQGADLWQSDQVNTNLRSANTEGGLLLQSDRPISYCACVHARPFIRTQKRPDFALTGKTQAFLMLTFSDWHRLRQPARWVQQYTSKEKVGPLWYCFLYLVNPAIRGLCAVQRICKEAHNASTVCRLHCITKSQDGFLIKRTWIRITTAYSSSFQYRHWGNIPTYRFHYSIFQKRV